MANKMVGEIICVGDEILFGDILNTNTQYLSQRLTDLGIFVYHQSVVGDDDASVAEAVLTAVKRSDVILFTGGLGPTTDDLTKEAITKALGGQLELDQRIADKLKDFFQNRGYQMTDNNLKQAMIPDIGEILENNNGTAPGIYIPYKNKHIGILPGPPQEMKPMFENEFVPVIKKHLLSNIYSKTLKLVGIGESDAASRIQHIIDKFQNPIIAPYAKASEVHFRITGSGDSMEDCKKLVEDAELEIKEILGQNIYMDRALNLIDVIVKLMKEHHLTIGLAESCTGGLLSKIFVDVPSVSDVFKEGIVVYSNEAKVRHLGVNPSTIETYGAVSEETATEMVYGLKRVAGTDVAISITGIAGPSGGTKDKPVGLVHIGILFNDDLYHYKVQLTGNREKVRENAAKKALTYLYFILKDNYGGLYD